MSNVITIYGVCAVSFMMAMYALEYRGRQYIFAFAFACLLSSAYGFLSGAWPFGVSSSSGPASLFGATEQPQAHRWTKGRASLGLTLPLGPDCDLLKLTPVARHLGPEIPPIGFKTGRCKPAVTTRRSAPTLTGWDLPL